MNAAPRPPRDARAWIELDPEAVRANVRTIRAATGVPLLAVVKADGYGHGAAWVARAALSAGAESLGVASPGEALRLRRAGLACPIQVLGACLPDELPAAVEARACLTIHEAADLPLLRAAAAGAGRPLGVQLKVDIGMARHGVAPAEALDLLAAVAADPALRLEGLMSHLPSACAADLSGSRAQIAQFAAVVEAARARDLLPPKVHAAASAAAFRLPEARFSQVRAGIAVVGLDPTGCLAAGGVSLRPAMTLRARVSRTRRVRAGQAVGYGGRWTAPRDGELAIVSLGYGDGLPYGLTGSGAELLLQGRRCPLVGTVMMDYLLVDVSALPEPVRPGDVVTLVGRDGAARLPLEEQAARARMIPYAFACGLGAGLGKRIARVELGTPAILPARERRAA